MRDPAGFGIFTNDQDERWLASTTGADNGPGTPGEEGLSYIVLEALAGRSDQLKEYTIGVEALGKPEGYDPRLDPTVRVDISKLRAKMETDPRSPRRIKTVWGSGYMFVISP